MHHHRGWGYARVMRAEATHWLSSAQADREVADVLLRAARYSHAVFMAYRSAEKALKAAVLVQSRDYPPLTHNLRLSAERTQSPTSEGVETALLRLAPHYTASRYPDVAQGQPELQYNRAITVELLRAAGEVRAWAIGLGSSGDGES